MSPATKRRERSRWLPSLDLSRLPLPKEAAACCVAKVDAHGRLPIGYCGPDCERSRRARLIRGFVSESRVPAARVAAYLDEYPGWEPSSDVWDDPTGDAACGVTFTEDTQ